MHTFRSNYTYTALTVLLHNDTLIGSNVCRLDILCQANCTDIAQNYKFVLEGFTSTHFESLLIEFHISRK